METSPTSMTRMYKYFCLFIIVYCTELSVADDDSSLYMQTLTGTIRASRTSQFLTSSSGIELVQSYQKDVIERAEELLSNRAILTAGGLNVSEKCLNHTWLQITALVQQKPWSLAMLDAAGKLPSGILSGNLLWIGDYDECVNVTAVIYPGPENETEPEHPFTGKYCSIAIPLVPNVTAQQAMGAKFPQGSLVLGLCVPSSCGADDILELVHSGVSLLPILNTSIAVCQEETLEYDDRAIIVLVILGVYAVLLLLGTAYDVVFIQWPSQVEEFSEKGENLNGGENLIGKDDGAVQHGEQSSNIRYRLRPDEYTPLLKAKTAGTEPEKKSPGLIWSLLLCFSVYTNGAKILNTDQPAGSLRAVHGIRFLSLSWVIMGHSYAFGMGEAANVMPWVLTLFKRWTFQALGNATVSVDSFFTLSGLLSAYLVLKELRKNNGKMNWFMFYFHRFWRLTPPYMLVLMVYVPLFKYWSNGPFWPQDGIEIDYCRTTWWTNILYINNFFKTMEGCMGWSWYLANDMQFYIVSPLLIVPLFYSGLIGGIICGAFLLTVTVIPGVLSAVYKLSPGMVDLTNPNAQMDFMLIYYVKPYCRMGPYIIGIITGYILYKTDCKFKMSRIVNLLGWAVAAVCCLSVLYGLYDTFNGHPVSVGVSALYNAVNRTVWAIGLCWVVFACATGYGGFVNTLLSWEALIPLSRLSYCAYLVHPVVMMLYFMNAKRLVHYDDLQEIYTYFGNLVASYCVAFVTSLAFEGPLLGLEKVIFKRDRRN